MPYQHSHGGHRQRLRRRFSDNPGSLEDHELIELLLFYAIPQKDTNALAHDLLNRFGSVSALVNADPEQVRQVPGMGETSSQLLSVLLEVFRRYLSERFALTPGAYDPGRLGVRYLPYFLGMRDEQVLAIALDEKGKEKGTRIIGEGDFNSSVINTAVLNTFVVRHQPCTIVLAHNHPSGIALPSESDMVTTDLLAGFLQECGSSLLDHLIFDGKGDFVSLGADGQLQGRNRYYYRVSQRPAEVPGGVDFSVHRTSLTLEILTKKQIPQDFS